MKNSMKNSFFTRLYCWFN